MPVPSLACAGVMARVTRMRPLALSIGALDVVERPAARSVIRASPEARRVIGAKIEIVCRKRSIVARASASLDVRVLQAAGGSGGSSQ